MGEGPLCGNTTASAKSYFFKKSSSIPTQYIYIWCHRWRHFWRVWFVRLIKRRSITNFMIVYFPAALVLLFWSSQSVFVMSSTFLFLYDFHPLESEHKKKPASSCTDLFVGLSLGIVMYNRYNRYRKGTNCEWHNETIFNKCLQSKYCLLRAQNMVCTPLNLFLTVS